MKQRTLIYRLVALSFAMSVALNVWFFVENHDLRMGIDIYKDMIKDYSEGSVDVIESAVIDSIQEQKHKKNNE